jgi:starvation-inducible outer membrane lipoprotein
MGAKRLLIMVICLLLGACLSSPKKSVIDQTPRSQQEAV